MKIQQSSTTFVSDGFSDQTDVLRQARSTVRTRAGLLRRQNSTGISQRWMDKVSIQYHRHQTTRYNFSARVNSESIVTSALTGETEKYGQKNAIEQLATGITGRTIRVNRMAGGNRGFEGTVFASQAAVKSTLIHFEQENTRFSSQGSVTTQDGRTIDFSLDMTFERSFWSKTREQALIERWQQQNLTDPLVISLDGNAPFLSDTVFEFDLDGDGETQQINFAGAGSGFLALDKNSDGKINDGTELFGPATGNGFQELSAWDEDQNQWIDENDAVFSKLSVWVKDEEGNDRLLSLKEAGIGAVSLGYADTVFDFTGNENQLKGRLKQSGVFLFEDGRAGSIHHIDLVSHDNATNESSFTGQTGWMLTQQGLDAGMFARMPEIRIASGPAASEETESGPLKELLDKIEKLKEDLAKLLEVKTPEPIRLESDVNRFYLQPWFGSGSILF